MLRFPPWLACCFRDEGEAAGFRVEIKKIRILKSKQREEKFDVGKWRVGGRPSTFCCANPKSSPGEV